LKYSSTVETLHLAIRDVLQHLRRGKGFDEEAFRGLETALEDCEVAWKNSDAIPKSAVSLLVDLQRIIENCAYAYPGDEGERIRRESYVVGDLISKIVPWEGPRI
jgi:hypothetical protein